jgi:iron complex transport system substrate-binding protein
MRLQYMIPGLILLACSCHNSADRTHMSGNVQTIASSRLTIEENDGSTKLVIRDPWQNARGAELNYYLLPQGSVLPSDIREEQVIRVPVRRMIIMSTTHLAMLRALDATDLLVGMAGPQIVYDSLILDAVAGGIIRDVGYEGTLNSELIVSLEPDVLVAYGVTAPSSGQLGRLTSMGVRVIYDADYLEEHPLARYRWIKLFGLLAGKQAMADSIFEDVSVRYNELAERVRKSVRERPTVLLGAPWEDVWYISPSNSYIGRLIEDAGGHYLFRDLRESNSVPFSVEAVFKRAADADIWINPGTSENMSEIAAADHRLIALPVCGSGEVWNNRKRITPEGGNDYWESAVVHPDILLMDFVSIIHPELLPEYTPYYYRKLE